MSVSLQADDLQDILAALTDANAAFQRHYPGDSMARQPVHTLYGGGHLFKPGLHRKLGGLALRSLQAYAPDFAQFARALGMPGAETLPVGAAATQALTEVLETQPDTARITHEAAWRAHRIYQRVCGKLEEEPVEDLRIDFEDGYGVRADAEEDGHAVQAAERLAAAIKDDDLPPFIGIRIKTFTEESRARAIRTLDLFLTTLTGLVGPQLPPEFLITLPKVTIPGHVTALAQILDKLEARLGIKAGHIGIDLMIEMTQVMINEKGENIIYPLVKAGQGRVRSAAFGTFDYTAACNITAPYQSHTHAASDFARHIMQVSLAGTGVTISDGATTTMPIGPHRAPKGETLAPALAAENRAAVHEGWRIHFANISHSLAHGYYQGWDLNPAQLPVRYAAVYYFFLSGLDDATLRLTRFLEQAAQATLVGSNFDDAATGQGLLNFFLRGLACGALTEEEVLQTGISLEELRSRSFLAILQGRSQ